MANILAFDTSADSCSVALFYGDATYSRVERTARDHNRLILPMIDSVLLEAGIALARLDALAVASGPGSFTGIRIGIGVAQGLAFGADLPVLPVSTLQTLAAGAIRGLETAEDSVIMACLDARMDEVYWGLYQGLDGFPEPLASDRLDKPEFAGREWQHHVQRGSAKLVGVGDGWRFRDRIAGIPAVVALDALPEAVDVLFIAQHHFARGLAVKADALEPSYLRSSVGWKKREPLSGG